ncbi:abortive infection family protein [Lysinibacillus sp. NPDC086135]|uniref:abortive infection family protein n=1 Tax=Lysinibacillus sp. NPDC086135 TaxID=3364130 RepID=UPI0037F81AE3
MSSLSSEDRLLFEKLLVRSGRVLDFNNLPFGIFVLESTGIDIYDGYYSGIRMSDASRLRLFIETESNFVVQKLLSELLSIWYKKMVAYDYEFNNDESFERCKKILTTLNDNNAIEDIDNISAINNTQGVDLLSSEIKEKLLENNPELALDRLHTYSVKFFRELCIKHDLQFEKDDALHTLIASYWKALEKSKSIQSDMTIQILKTNTNILNNFNNVRNDKSYAHDNVILNKSESKLICNHVISLLKFIDEIEENSTVQKSF